MLMPTPKLTLDSNIAPETSRTYKIDFSLGRILGIIDELEAIKQFIQKAILTERYKYIIYDEQTGTELYDLLSGNYTEELLKTELPRVITDALIYDTRIISIDNFVVDQDGESINVSFDVQTIFGSISIQEVI